MHGWPGSVFELIGLIDPLAHPERYGELVNDAFTVVVPSLPGFGFSVPPPSLLNPQDVASLWHRLMEDVLGFGRYVAHNGDIGATVTPWMGAVQRFVLPVIHLSNAVLFAEWTLKPRPPESEEAAYLPRQQDRRNGEDAYQRIHAEKPAAVGFLLADSPLDFREIPRLDCSRRAGAPLHTDRSYPRERDDLLGERFSAGELDVPILA
jgi:microsomal epoxide hydrolase